MRPKWVKNDKFIVTFASRRADAKTISAVQRRKNGLLLSLLKVSQSNQWDQLQVGSWCSWSLEPG